MVKIYKLNDCGDDRGYSFAFPKEAFDFIGDVADTHASSIVPGAIRGNHYHKHKKELLLVLSTDRWTFAWDKGEGTQVTMQEVQEAEAILVAIEPGAAHALKNTGIEPLTIFALTSKNVDPDKQDLYRKIIL